MIHQKPFCVNVLTEKFFEEEISIKESTELNSMKEYFHFMDFDNYVESKSKEREHSIIVVKNKIEEILGENIYTALRNASNLKDLKSVSLFII